MSFMVDITADQSPLPGRPAVQNLATQEMASLAEELVAYHQHFAPLFYRREQREWAALYLRGLLTADVPRKNVEAMALRLLGARLHAEREVRALQQFIGEGKWDDDALLTEHQHLVNETLGEEDGSVAKNFKLIKTMPVVAIEVNCTQEKEHAFYLFYNHKILKYPSF